MIARDDLHAMLDAVPEDRLPAVRDVLARVTDPVLLAFMNSPEVDEPLTEEDLAAIAEGKADVARGEVISLDEVERRLLGPG